MKISTTQAIIGLFASTTRAALYSQVISTNYGNIQGYPAFNSTPAANLSNWKDITVFKGIPFAADTSGNNRFRAPQPASPWNSTLDARNYGDICPSGGSGYTISENCLNLNVWTAANSTDAKLPVVMWSYPAGGSAADSMFDGAGMADKGVVFVNYNYRTGAFGWMAHPELNPEVELATGHNVSGNWGMLDQFAAVKWIHENIASFGGDPEHITVRIRRPAFSETLADPATPGDGPICWLCRYLPHSQQRSHEGSHRRCDHRVWCTRSS